MSEFDAPWYEEAEEIAAKAEHTGESQLAWNIAALVRKYVTKTKEEHAHLPDRQSPQS